MGSLSEKTLFHSKNSVARENKLKDQALAWRLIIYNRLKIHKGDPINLRSI